MSACSDANGGPSFAGTGRGLPRGCAPAAEDTVRVPAADALPGLVPGFVAWNREGASVVVQSRTRTANGYLPAASAHPRNASATRPITSGQSPRRVWRKSRMVGYQRERSPSGRQRQSG